MIASGIALRSSPSEEARESPPDWRVNRPISDGVRRRHGNLHLSRFLHGGLCLPLHWEADGLAEAEQDLRSS